MSNYFTENCGVLSVCKNPISLPTTMRMCCAERQVIRVEYKSNRPRNPKQLRMPCCNPLIAKGLRKVLPNVDRLLGFCEAIVTCVLALSVRYNNNNEDVSNNSTYIVIHSMWMRWDHGVHSYLKGRKKGVSNIGKSKKTVYIGVVLENPKYQNVGS